MLERARFKVRLRQQCALQRGYQDIGWEAVFADVQANNQGVEPRGSDFHFPSQPHRACILVSERHRRRLFLAPVLI